jgi:hypothetical protein
LAPSQRAVVAQVVADRLVAAVRPVVRLQVAVLLAHKLLPLVRLQVAVVLAPRRVPLPPEPEVAALLVLVQGLVASQSLHSR